MREKKRLLVCFPAAAPFIPFKNVLMEWRQSKAAINEIDWKFMPGRRHARSLRSQPTQIQINSTNSSFLNWWIDWFALLVAFALPRSCCCLVRHSAIPIEFMICFVSFHFISFNKDKFIQVQLNCFIHYDLWLAFLALFVSFGRSQWRRAALNPPKEPKAKASRASLALPFTHK